VVDEFAHTNVPGSSRPKRWQDVAAILDAGIDVLTSLNVQHIESLNDGLHPSPAFTCAKPCRIGS
jgi:two-component system sensor histidine kinase KdpD